MEAQKAKAILNKKINAGDIIISDFILYYRAIEQKQHGTGKRHVEEWKRMEDPETNPCNYNHLI
jgi:hypothetical protein